MLRILLSCLILLGSVPSFGVRAKGFVRPESCSLYNLLGSDGLHLTSIDGRRLRKPVVLKFPMEGAWYNLIDTWMDTTGAYCHRADCEPITHARVRIRHVSKGMFIPFRGRRINGVSGDFNIDFSDGKKLEGSFKVKTRKPAVQLICE